MNFPTPLPTPTPVPMQFTSSPDSTLVQAFNAYSQASLSTQVLFLACLALAVIGLLIWQNRRNAPIAQTALKASTDTNADLKADRDEFKQTLIAERVARLADAERHEAERQRFMTTINNFNNLMQADQTIRTSQMETERRRIMTYEGSLKAMDAMRVDGLKALAEERQLVESHIGLVTQRLDSQTEILGELVKLSNALPNAVGDVLRPELMEIAETVKSVNAVLATVEETKTNFLGLFDGVKKDLERQLEQLGDHVARLNAAPGAVPVLPPSLTVS